jgi:hypothetical protein
VAAAAVSRTKTVVPRCGRLGRTARGLEKRERVKKAGWSMVGVLLFLGWGVLTCLLRRGYYMALLLVLVSSSPASRLGPMSLSRSNIPTLEHLPSIKLLPKAFLCLPALIPVCISVRIDDGTGKICTQSQVEQEAPIKGYVVCWIRMIN